MNYILVAVLTFIAIIIYINEKGNILSPNLLTVLMFLLSSLLLTISYPYWRYSVSPKTVMVICGGLICFCLGNSLGKRTQVRRTLEQNISTFEIKTLSFYFLASISCIISIAYAMYQYNLSIALGNTSGFLGMFGVLRSAIVNNPELGQLSLIMNLGISFTRAFGFISLYILLSRVICKKKKTFRYLIPIFCMFFCSLLTSGRAGLIGIVAAIVFNLYHILSHTKNSKSKKGRKKIQKILIRSIIIGFVGFILIFWGVGYLTGKSMVLSFWDTISIYAGSSILCLDSYLNNNVQMNAKYFGQYTFRGLYNILRRIIPTIPITSMHAEFVFWGEYASNIYTSFFPYLLDFDIIGLLIIEILLGFIIGMAWKKFNQNGGKSIITFYYGRCFGYAIVMSSIAEYLCSEMLALNFFVELIFAIGIIKFFIRPVKLDIGQRMLNNNK